MLLPLLTSTRYYRFPAVVLLLVLVNGAVFWATKEDIPSVASRWGFTPSASGESFAPFWPRDGRAETLLTHAFLHGGWLHLVGNMWMLAVFGSALEVTIGHLRFAAVYLGLAVGAVMVHGMLSGGPPRPCIGASGAISGVLGCYVALEPRSRVLSIFSLLVIFFFTEIPTAFYVVVWLIIQIDGIQTHLLSGFDCRNIAWWAHLGGFSTGMILGIAMAAIAGKKQSTEDRSIETELDLL